MLRNTPKIEDQYTDRSGRLFAKLASRIKDRNLRALVSDTFFSDTERLTKQASVATFRTDTPEDTLLSSLYFNGQKHLMKNAEAASVGAKLATMRALYDMPDMELEAEGSDTEKTASEGAELIPGVTAYDYTGLLKLGSDFEANYRRLDYGDRVAFSRNFVKFAAEAADVPESVCLYAGVNTALREDAVDQLYFRKAAAERAGKNGDGYALLADVITAAGGADASPAELNKLAEAVYNLDDSLGLTGTEYDRRLPDAWHAMLKKAESSNNDSGISDTPKPVMSKADIVGRFGEQALDEVENPDGSINAERLKQIMALFGDSAADSEHAEKGNVGKNVTEGDKRE